MRAILPAHLYGHPADLNSIRRLGKAHELPVVEDAAECLGAKYRGVRVGAEGDLVCLSFKGNKVITAGGGKIGAHVTGGLGQPGASPG